MEELPSEQYASDSVGKERSLNGGLENSMLNEKKFDGGSVLHSTPRKGIDYATKIIDEEESYITLNSDENKRVSSDVTGSSRIERTPSKIPSMSLSRREAGNARRSIERAPSDRSLSKIPSMTPRKDDPCPQETELAPGPQESAPTTGGRRRRIRQRSTGDINSFMSSPSPMKLTRQNSSDGLDQLGSEINRSLDFIKEENHRTSITDRLYEDAKYKIVERQKSAERHEEFGRLYDDFKQGIYSRSPEDTKSRRAESVMSPGPKVGRSSVLDRLYDDAKQKNEERRSKEAELQQKMIVKTPNKKQIGASPVLDRLYDDAKRKHEARRVEEELGNFAQQQRSMVKTPDHKQSDRISVLDRLYEDAKVKFSRQAVEGELIAQEKRQKQAKKNSDQKHGERVSVLDRLYDDAKRKNEARRQAEEEEMRKLEQRKKTLENNGDRISVLDRLYDDAKQKFSRQAEEEMQQREEEQKALQRKLDPKKADGNAAVAARLYEDGKRKIEALREEEKQKLEEEEKAQQQKMIDAKQAEANAVASRLYEDGKRKIEAQREEEKHKYEEEQKALQQKKIDLKQAEANVVATRLYADGKRKINAQREAEEAKAREEAAIQRRLKSGKMFQPNLSLTAKYSEQKKTPKKPRPDAEKEMSSNHSNSDCSREVQKELAVTPKTRPVSSVKFASTKKKQESAQFSNELKNINDDGRSKQKQDENFSPEFFNRLQTMEEKKSIKLAQLKAQTEKEFSYKPTKYVKSKKIRKDDTALNGSTSAQIDQESHPNKKGGSGILGSIWEKKQQLPQCCDQASSGTSVGEESKDGGRSEGSGESKKDGNNFSSEFFERLQAMEKKKSTKLARLKEEAEKELTYRPKNFVKNNKSTKQSQRESRKECENKVETTHEKGGPNIFGFLFGRTNASNEEPCHKKDEKTSVGGGTSRQKQGDGENFSSEFFDRLQAMEKKKSTRLARLKEEADKEYSYKPKNYVKSKKFQKLASEGAKKETDKSSGSAHDISRSRDLFTPLDEQNQSESEKAFSCWRPWFHC